MSHIDKTLAPNEFHPSELCPDMNCRAQLGHEPHTGDCRQSVPCVIYRTGGRGNFVWQRSLGMSRSEANVAAAETQRMGYCAFVGTLDEPLPTSYVPESSMIPRF